MSNSVFIQIYRRHIGAKFSVLVEVHAGKTDVGYHNGYVYPLTLTEEEEVRKLLTMEGIAKALV